MKKLLLSFLFLLSFVALFPFTPSAQAAAPVTCTIETDPAQVTTDDEYMNLKITTNGLVDGKKYRLWLGNWPLTKTETSLPAYATAEDFTLRGGVLQANDVSPLGVIRPSRPSGGVLKKGGGLYSKFSPMTYTVQVTEPALFSFTDKVLCEASFTVKDTRKADCDITYTNTSFTSNDDVSVKITGLPPGLEFATYVQENGSSATSLTKVCHTSEEYANGVPLGKFENGSYFVAVFSGSLFGKGGCTLSSIPSGIFDKGLTIIDSTAKYCSSAFSVPGGGISVGSNYSGPVFGKFTAIGGTPPPSPCKNTGTPAKPVYVCQTAVGEINTNPTEFVKRIMGIFLGLAGGIAVLLIMSAGYKILTSQGEPEKIQEARDTITSTIIGLLFMIFAIVILQIIGIDILQIPGFRR